MSIDDLKREVAKLSPADVAHFAAWIADYDAQLWDEQIAADLQAGRLDAVINQVEHDIDARRQARSS